MYELWEDLIHIAHLVGDQACVVCDDFNIVRNANERFGGVPPDVVEMVDFNNCLNDIQVVEMNTKGASLTSDNKRDDEDNIKSRIDWGFCNEC